MTTDNARWYSSQYWSYHPEGSRVFILDSDGFTICEVVCPAGNDRVELAAFIVREHNARIDNGSR